MPGVTFSPARPSPLPACEPHLKPMFAIFTTLTRDEEMPRLEEIQSHWPPFRGWRKRLVPPGRGGRRTAQGAWERMTP
jgi:hypothetical protein